MPRKRTRLPDFALFQRNLRSPAAKKGLGYDTPNFLKHFLEDRILLK